MLDGIGWIPGRVETEKVVVLLVLRLSPQLTTEFLVKNNHLAKNFNVEEMVFHVRENVK
jgi:hypothetical protein